MVSFEVERLLEEALAGTLCLDCPSVTLQPRWNPLLPPVTGPGEFRLDPSRRLSLKLFGSHKPPNAPVRTGELLSDDAYFTLRATDVQGREWICDRVLPDATSTAANGECVVVADIWQLEHQIPNPLESIVPSVVFATSDEIAVPANDHTETVVTSARGSSSYSVANLSTGEVSGTHIVVENLPRGLRAFLAGPAVSPSTDMRIAEALRFVCAKQMEWHFLWWRIGKKETIQIRSRFPRTTLVRLHPPLANHGRVDLHGAIFGLIARYFEFVSAQMSDDWHPVSHHVYAACEGSAGSTTQQCLTLAVAVEGILNLAIPPAGKPAQKLKDAISSLQKHVDQWVCVELGDMETEFRKRLGGLLSMLNQEGAARRLANMATDGVILQDEVISWKRVRNAAAHGANTESRASQERITDIARVTTLMYRLIFLMIDYRGKYTDYSIEGWPTRIFGSAKVPSPPTENVAAGEHSENSGNQPVDGS